MPLVLADRVKETSTTTSTGTLTLAGAVTGFQSFSSGIGVGNTCYYAIQNSGTSEWEVGLGTVGSGTLSRDTVLASSNSNSLVNLSAGTKDVFCTYPAERAVTQDNTLTANAPQIGASNGIVINNKTVSASYSIPSGYSAMSAGPITVASGQSVTVPSGSRWVVL